MPHEADYSILLDLFFELVESQAEKKFEPGQEWMNDAQVLAKKLYQHLISMRLIAEGTTVERDGNPKTSFVDHASVKVVARAALETYLVFYYIYGNHDHSLSEFRHKIWRIGGLADRQKIHPISEKVREVLALDQKHLDKLRSEIEGSPHLEGCKPRQKRNLLAGKWRSGISWADIGTSAGFHENYFKSIYGYLCGYAHSSYLSALQVGQAESIKEQQMLTQSILGVGIVLMAHFAFFYSTVFTSAEDILSANPDAKGVAEKWRLGPEDMGPIWD